MQTYRFFPAAYFDMDVLLGFWIDIFVLSVFSMLEDAIVLGRGNYLSSNADFPVCRSIIDYFAKWMF